MKWTRKNEPYSRSYSLTGRKNGYKAIVRYDGHYKNYYFLTIKQGHTYNSLWDKLSYNTEEECVEACENYCEGRRTDDGKTRNAEKGMGL